MKMYRVFVTDYTMALRVEQMARNVGSLPDWDLVEIGRMPGGYEVIWYDRR